MDARRFRAGCRRLTVLVCVWAAALGCHLPWQLRSSEESPDKSAKQATPSTSGETAKSDAPRSELPKSLADDRWVQASSFALREPGPSGYYWQHQSLEAWAAAGGDHTAELTRALADANPVIASNAAILLARADDAAGVDRLASTVGNTELRLPLRNAAVEALARLDDPAAAKALDKLVGEFGQFSGPAQAAYVPRLHAELLIARARRVDAENAPFTHALKSPAPEVRRAALQAWLSPARTGFPEVAIELRDDSNPAVRAALLATSAVQQPEQARDILTRGLDDLDMDARMAAIAGLASLGGDESKAALRKLCRHPSEVARASVVIGLAKLGVDDAVHEAAKDKSWLVRQAVATSLARPAETAQPVADETVARAQTLLHDKSLEVQRRTLESVATWPLPQAGPVLLAAMSDGGHQLRKDAAHHLGALWPTAAKFPYDGAAEVRTKATAELRRQWSDQLAPATHAVAVASVEQPGEPDTSTAEVEKLKEPLQVLRNPHVSTARRQQAVETLVAFGPPLVALLERMTGEGQEPLPQIVYEDVLTKVSPLFAAIEGLHLREMPQRRTAAAQLVIAAGGNNISRLALERLAELAKTENDPVVWQSLLAVAANDPRAKKRSTWPMWPSATVRPKCAAGPATIWPLMAIRVTCPC